MSVIRRPGIPIPSFSGVDVSPSQDGGSPKPSSNSNGVPASWKVASMMQLEVSLQHWCRRRHKKRMSLEVFFQLAKKLDNSNANGATKTKKPSEHDALVRAAGLTVEERLLHDLLSVAANPSMAEPLYRMDTDKGLLEPIAHSADQLRRVLTSTLMLDKQWSEKIIAMILMFRKRKEDKQPKRKEATSSSHTDSHSITPVITKGMTIDERVRAKAKARQQNEKLVQQRQLKENPKQLLCKTKDTTWTIQLADALCLHARSILQRQNYHLPTKLASTSLLNSKSTAAKRTVSRRCVLSFANVVQTIAKSRLGEASAVQIAKALTELEQFSPKWIEVKHGNKRSNNKKSFKWCFKTTTVFILPDHYPNVRSQLTGQPAHNKGTRIILAPGKTTARKPILYSSLSNPKQRSPVLSKNLLGDFDKLSANKKQISSANSSTPLTTITANSSPSLETPLDSSNNKRKRVDPI